LTFRGIKEGRPLLAIPNMTISHLMYGYIVPERKRDFSSSSRQIKILTTGIHRVFRGLKFLFNEEIGGKGHFRSGTT